MSTPAPDSDDATQASEDPAEARDISWGEAPYIAGSAFCMGTADVVPGVSGGTMAVALGIYAQLLNAITSIDLQAARDLLTFKLSQLLSRVHWRFLAMLVLGAGTGIGIMVKVVRLPHLIEHEPKYVYAAFLGLVMASAVVLARRIPHWTGRRAGSLAFGAAFGFAVVNLVPVATPETPLFVFASGTVAISAMLLPGISGSFILLILGKYAYVLNALGSLNLAVLVPFLAGCLVGVTMFSRIVGWALTRWEHTVMAGLTGLLIGSLWRIWPYQKLTTVIVRDKPRVVGSEPFMPTELEPSVLSLFAVGLVLVFLIERVARLRQAAS